MYESIAVALRSVRPNLPIYRLHERAAPCQASESFFCRLDAFLKDERHRSSTEHDPRHTRGFKYSTIFLRQTIDLAFNHFIEALGHLEVSRLKIPFCLPLPVLVHQSAASDQVINDVYHEERVAVGAPMHLCRQAGGRVRDPCLQIFGNCLACQELKLSFLAKTVCEEVLLESDQGVGVRLQFHGPIGTNQQDPAPLSSTCEIRKQADARRIAPVQILKDHDHRIVHSKSLKRLGQLSNHALPRQTRDFALKGSSFGGLDEPGKLHEPHGCVTTKQVCKTFFAVIGREVV